MTEPLRPEVVRHAARGNRREACLDELLLATGFGRAERDPKRVALVSTAPQLAMVSARVEDRYAFGGESCPVGVPAAGHAEPLPGNRVTILHARVADVCSAHPGMPGDLASNPFGIRPSLFDPEVFMLPSAAEFET